MLLMLFLLLMLMEMFLFVLSFWICVIIGWLLILLEYGYIKGKPKSEAGENLEVDMPDLDQPTNYTFEESIAGNQAL